MKLIKPLTQFGQAQLAEEHYQLAKIERPKVVEGIATAAAEGDRSENAEYIYGKKRLREMDRRIRYLNQLLKGAQIIRPEMVDLSQVSFGSVVQVERDGSSVAKYAIVGEGETEFFEFGVSWKSPVGKALLGKKTGDFLEIEIPKGWVELEVQNISPLVPQS